MRISGLASGFDTDEMVKQLMQVERMKVDKVEQNKQIMLWRQESYNNINKSFANFILNTQKNLGLKKASSTGALFGSSYKNVDYVKKAVVSNESVATATVSAKDVNGSYTFTVKQLAEEASFVSGDMSGKEYGEELSFKLNGETINVEAKDGENITMDDVAKAINNAKTTDEKGKEVSLGVTAFYDKGNGRLFIQGSNGDEIEIESSGNANGDKFIEDIGKDDAVYNGVKKSIINYKGIDLEYDSNNIQLNGLNIELKTTSTDPITINVSTNTEGIIEKIEQFVEEYNKLIDEVSDLINEKVYSTYKPLSEEERKALSESDVKLWDEKAKSGLLNRDENLQRILQNMRTDLYKTLDGNGTFNHITQIGISTESYAKGTAGGRLQIDTDKLRKAIEEDADGVMDLLFKEGNFDKDGKEIFESSGKVEGLSTKGVFTRIYDDLIDGMKGIIDKSGHGGEADLYRGIKSNMLIDFVTKKSSISDIDKSINDMNRQIDNLNVLLARKEESHYAKFTAMEKAMYQMNNQSNWLAQQFFM